MGPYIQVYELQVMLLFKQQNELIGLVDTWWTLGGYQHFAMTVLTVMDRP